MSITLNITFSRTLFFLLISNLEVVTSNNQSLLVILLDGFRWSYLHETPPNGGFQKFVKGGVQAEYMKPLYPSESFPGYYAITTGLYGENNGFPLNYMYDKEKNVFFKMLPDQPFWWEEAEPLWITTTKNNISTATFLWPGGEIPIKGIHPQIYTSFKRVYTLNTFQKDLEKALNLFVSKEIHYAQVYCEFIDFYGHLLGPDIVIGHLIPNYMDPTIMDLLNNVEKKELQDSLNIVILSDHGMTKTDKLHAKTIELNKVLNEDDVEYVLDRGSHVGIYPKKEKFREVYTNLKKLEGVEVYERHEIPEKYHIKNNLRTPPIFVVVNKGYYLRGLYNNKKQIPRDFLDWQWFGFHGYDSEKVHDMRAIFIARGPAFKKNLVTPPISIVDPYNLLAHLVGVKPLPNNGTWDNVKDMLV